MQQHKTSLLVASVSAAGLLTLAGSARAQNTPAPQQQQRPLAPNSTVMVVTENPALRLLDKANGTALTDINFWRVSWSPAGPGSVCFITVRNTPGMNMRVAITDNEKLVDYIVNGLMGPLGGYLSNPPYAVQKGTIVQTASATERTETCKTDQQTVAITWKDLATPSYVAGFRPPGSNDIVQTFVMVIARGAEVKVNGKTAPGTYFPSGGGFGPGAFLALNETWHREVAK